jgi:hypothetical protein
MTINKMARNGGNGGVAGQGGPCHLSIPILMQPRRAFELDLGPTEFSDLLLYSVLGMNHSSTKALNGAHPL